MGNEFKDEIEALQCEDEIKTNEINNMKRILKEQADVHNNEIFKLKDELEGKNNNDLYLKNNIICAISENVAALEKENKVLSNEIQGLKSIESKKCTMYTTSSKELLILKQQCTMLQETNATKDSCINLLK